MTTLTLNKSALEFFGSAEKVRVQARDGALRIRPTARKSHVNLPKGEKLVSLTRKGDGAKIVVEDLEGVAQGNLAARTDRYGWLALAGAPARGEASVKVA